MTDLAARLRACGFLTTGAFDTFEFLYATAFDPSTPLVNAVVADDDLLAAVPLTTSGFGTSLSAGTRYSLITTGVAGTDFGAFTSMITGPGNVQAVVVPAVPAPGSALLLLAGIGVMSRVVRRRRHPRHG